MKRELYTWKFAYPDPIRNGTQLITTQATRNFPTQTKAHLTYIHYEYGNTKNESDPFIHPTELYYQPHSYSKISKQSDPEKIYTRNNILVLT